MGRETDGILSLGPVAPSFSCISTSDPLSTTCVFILLAPEKSQDDQIGMSDTEVKWERLHWSVLVVMTEWLSQTQNTR